MKRPMTLTAGILGTVMHAIYSISELLVFAAIIDLLNSVSSSIESMFLVVILILTLALSVVSLVFNALAIAPWNKVPELYRKKRGIIITAVVFNFIVIVFLIIGMAANGAAGILDILLMLAIIAANVLFIVDLALEKKRVAKLDENGEIPTVASEESNDVEQKIEKLNEMKAQGMISEDEYEELKKSYINEKLNG